VTDRLGIYNGALRLIGETQLASLTERREARFLLDGVWDTGGVRRCLEAGQWNFAARVVELQNSPSVTPQFGYQFAFERPSIDFVRLVGLSTDASVRDPYTSYEYSGGFYFANSDVIYIRYVSDDPVYGGDLAMWPESFTDFVEAHFAREIVRKISASETKFGEINEIRRKRLTEAQSIDGQAGPSQRPPLGGWARSRLHGGFHPRRW
jgi:hypothetical protein